MLPSGRGVILRHLNSEDPMPHSKAPGYAIVCDVFPGRLGYAQALQVSFSNLPENAGKGGRPTGAFSQFTLEEVLRDTARFHTPDVAEPAQTPVAKKGEHAGLFQDFSVGDFLLPGNV